MAREIAMSDLKGAPPVARFGPPTWALETPPMIGPPPAADRVRLHLEALLAAK
jgi:hypothetical protein